MNTTFSDIYYQPGENPVFCYRSGKMVYEETLYNGVLLASGWNGAGYPLNVLTNCPSRLNKNDFTEPFAFNIELDGQSVDHKLEFCDFSVEKDGEKISSVLILESRIKPVRIKIHTLLDGTQMFTRYLEIENHSDSYLNLSRLCVISGGIENIERDKMLPSDNVEDFYSLGYFDDDRWAREGEFRWHPLRAETTSVDTRFGRDRFRHPLYFIRNNVTGKIWSFQTGWSAGCRFTVDYNAHPGKADTYLSFKAEITAHNPMYIISPGESFVSPEVHAGLTYGDFDDAVNEMHSHIRKSVLDNPLIAPSDDLIGCGMGAEHDMSVETSKKFIDQFSEMGGELFIVDAGWECPPHREMQWGDFNGINIPDKERYPHGITEIADYCHEKGMKFGLWIEIESVGKFSDIYDKHPNWFACDIYGNRSQRFLDFTNPEVSAWAEHEIARLIEECKTDLLRVDYNTSCREYFGMSKRVADRYECISVAHFNAVAKMYMNLKKRFPHVIFENCAGGGGRTDLGFMKAFHHTWVTDNQCAPRSVVITNGMTMALPPERVDRLFAGMTCHEFGTLDLQMRNTMLTHMSLNVIAPAKAEINEVQMEFVKHSVGIYKSFIRPFINNSKIYHHTPECDKNCILELASEEKDRCVIGVFSLTCSGRETLTVKPKGIDASKQYKVTSDNERCSFSVSGRELKNAGIKVYIPSSLSSELLLIEEEI
ncbi:MAG: alpha-galactosidase [Clostridia bacterium]|nr:alpha-galactosidase [Clostridia bacterium]